MHPPKDLLVSPYDQDFHRLAAAPDPGGWQALYDAMLGHITGNVEVWLRSYLADVMAGRTPRALQGAAPEPHGSHAAAAGAAAAIRFATPPWLEPFNDPDNVRFTRTPDHILLQERGAGTVAATDDDANAPEALEPERRPFVLPPNVRNTRTPDRLLARADAPASAVPEAIGFDVAVAPAPVHAEPPEVAADVVRSEPLPEPTMVWLVADAFEPARAVEDAADAQGPLDDGPGPVGDAPADWPDAAPQPWGEVIQLGPVETPARSEEQDNRPSIPVRAALDPAPMPPPPDVIETDKVAPEPAVEPEPEPAETMAATGPSPEAEPDDEVLPTVPSVAAGAAAVVPAGAGRHRGGPPRAGARERPAPVVFGSAPAVPAPAPLVGTLRISPARPPGRADPVGRHRHDPRRPRTARPSFGGCIGGFRHSWRDHQRAAGSCCDLV